jgi:hypothetical protein
MPTAHFSRSSRRKISYTPTALMLAPDVGQLSFSKDGESFTFEMSRADFDRLARRMIALLREIPTPKQLKPSL